MSRTMDFLRNPCPDRIVEDAGVSFAMGILGGSAFHFLKGLCDSPNDQRLAGGATAVRMKAPRLGGSFAVWGGLYSAVDCGMVYARKKEDPWNSIAAGAATGGLLSLRQGLRASGRSALLGGAFLALIEGAGIVATRFMVPSQLPLPEDMDLPPAAGQEFLGVQAAPDAGFSPARPLTDELPPPELSESASTGWFAGLFGTKKQQHDKVAAKSEMLELELPSTAVPTFDYK